MKEGIFMLISYEFFKKYTSCRVIKIKFHFHHVIARSSTRTDKDLILHTFRYGEEVGVGGTPSFFLKLTQFP